jgi:hypothetical protein
VVELAGLASVSVWIALAALGPACRPGRRTTHPHRFKRLRSVILDEGDRHVAATALAARADAIVTRNVSDFAPDALFALGIEAYRAMPYYSTSGRSMPRSSAMCSGKWNVTG